MKCFEEMQRLRIPLNSLLVYPKGGVLFDSCSAALVIDIQEHVRLEKLLSTLIHHPATT
jgi:hypothetical protein